MIAFAITYFVVCVLTEIGILVRYPIALFFVGVSFKKLFDSRLMRITEHVNSKPKQPVADPASELRPSRPTQMLP